MNVIVRYIAVTLFCVASAARADKPLSKQSSLPSLNLQSSNSEVQNLGYVDCVIQMLNTRQIDYSKAMSVAQWIESATQLEFVKEASGANHSIIEADRTRMAKTILSPDRYLALERACSEQLKNENDKIRILAMYILARSLGSSIGRNYMVKVLKEGLAILETENRMPPSLEELFAAAENLAYLGYSDGVEVLESALGSDDSPSFLKRRAMNALARLGVPVTSSSMVEQLMSRDAAVAFTAFNLAEAACTNHVVISSAVSQLEMLRFSHTRKHALSYNQAALLRKLSLILSMAFRDGALTGEALDKAKSSAGYFIKCSDDELQERVVSLIAETASDSDALLIDCMLESRSSRVRSWAVTALFRCSPDTILARKKTLITLLDDGSHETRDAALFVLRKGLGEKAMNQLSEAEFLIQKARIVKKLKRLDE